MALRFTIGTFKTRERAEEVLDDMYANGEICEGEKPAVEPVREGGLKPRVVRWAITQEG